MVSNNDKRLVQVAMNGWKQFFHYFWRGRWRIAWNELQASKEHIRLMQEKM